LIDALLEPNFNCASLAQLLNIQTVVLPTKRKQDFVRKFRKTINGQVTDDDDDEDGDGGVDSEGVHGDVRDITIKGDKEASDGPAATKQELRQSTVGIAVVTTTQSSISHNNSSSSNIINVPSPEEEVVSFWKDVLASNSRSIRMSHVDMLRKRLYDLNREEIKRLQEEAQRLQIYFGSSTGLPTG
jgi:hypothetical protein